MEKLFQTLESIPDWGRKFQSYIDKNNLSNNLVDKLQSHNIESLSKHLFKLQQENKEKHKISWVSSQYQALEIVLNAISVISEKTIQEFNLAQWQQIYAIFPYKVPLTIKYESLRIVMEKKQPRRRWVASQQNFLIEIVRGFTKKNKWNDVARELFIKSDGEFFRQGKHCRERWLNHLHPSIQNNDWSVDEDLQLLTFVLKKGKKWARIAKKFEMKRSECMVKKRFFQLIKIEEQESLPMETLKNLIKVTLQQIRSQISQKREYQKQGFINQDVDIKGYKKSNGNFKTQSQKLLKEKKSFETREKSESQQIVEESPKQCFSPQKVAFSHEYQTFTASYSQGLGQQNYCFDYFGFMNNMFNPMYNGYQPIIVPFQNNIFMSQTGHQGSQYTMN